MLAGGGKAAKPPSRRGRRLSKHFKFEIRRPSYRVVQAVALDERAGPEAERQHSRATGQVQAEAAVAKAAAEHAASPWLPG
jgi:hypothetical protein